MKWLKGCSTSTIPGSCGYGVIYHHGLYPSNVMSVLPGGTGTAIAAFVDERRCRVVYDWIVENCVVLYQSPVEMNHNSGRRNFLVVFKVK